MTTNESLYKTKVLLPRALVTLAEFGNPVQALWFYCSQTCLNGLNFQSFVLSAPDESYSRHALCALNFISTFLLYTNVQHDSRWEDNTISISNAIMFQNTIAFIYSACSLYKQLFLQNIINGYMYQQLTVETWQITHNSELQFMLIGKRAISQLYRVVNKLLIEEILMLYALYWTNVIILQSASRHSICLLVAPFAHNIVITSQADVTLTP